MFLNSVIGTRNLLEAIKNTSVKRVLLVSSFSVYKTVDLPNKSVLSEDTETETVGIKKGGYAYTKVQQERLFLDLQSEINFESVIVRPGVLYGPGGGAMSARVGIRVLGVFASLGNKTPLPLNHVDNCASAIVYALKHAPSGAIYNLVDDELPSCGQYLKLYRKNVEKLRTFRIPYFLLLLGSKWLSTYSARSKGQLPAVLTPYVVKSMYRPLRYDNTAIKSIGWKPAINTNAGLQEFFSYLRGNQQC